jgi:hypothetical protein
MDHLQYPHKVFVFHSSIGETNDNSRPLNIDIRTFTASSFGDIVNYYEENKDKKFEFHDSKLNEHFGIKVE